MQKNQQLFYKSYILQLQVDFKMALKKKACFYGYWLVGSLYKIIIAKCVED